MPNNLKRKIKNEIVRWNNQFPIDYWWRKKYNVSYGSKAHREMNFIDMLIDYEEDKMMRNLGSEKEEEEVKGYTVPQKELDADFDDLDISKY